MRKHLTLCAAALTLALPAVAQENYESWPPLVNPFESTGGGGIMIGGYDPVVVDRHLRDRLHGDHAGRRGLLQHDRVRRRADPGRHPVHRRQMARADGSASGTTPFQVFIKDGMKRRSP